jgi:hypothetical protein
LTRGGRIPAAGIESSRAGFYGRAVLHFALPAVKLEAKFDLGHYLEQMDTFFEWVFRQDLALIWSADPF